MENNREMSPSCATCNKGIVGKDAEFQAFAQQDAKQREQKSCEEKARDAELIYLHHIEAHGIPRHVASCTTLLFKQMFPDSKIAEKFTFSDTKQGYEITHGLGQHYNNLTLVLSY